MCASEYAFARFDAQQMARDCTDDDVKTIANQWNSANSCSPRLSIHFNTIPIYSGVSLQSHFYSIYYAAIFIGRVTRFARPSVCPSLKKT